MFTPEAGKVSERAGETTLASQLSPSAPGAECLASVKSPSCLALALLCYQTAFATSASAAATVVDQFGQNDRKLFRADMFCAPARKTPLFKPIPVPPGADHLTCYHTEGRSINAIRPIINQLEQTRFRGLTPRYFCMPTYKKG